MNDSALKVLMRKHGHKISGHSCRRIEPAGPNAFVIRLAGCYPGDLIPTHHIEFLPFGVVFHRNDGGVEKNAVKNVGLLRHSAQNIFQHMRTRQIHRHWPLKVFIERVIEKFLHLFVSVDPQGLIHLRRGAAIISSCYRRGRRSIGGGFIGGDFCRGVSVIRTSVGLVMILFVALVAT